MANDNNPKAGNALRNILETIRNNPKAWYAIGGAGILLLLALAMGGGGSGKVQIQRTVQVGQTVTVTNPNVGDTQLTTIPGLMSVSGSEENDEQKVCVVKAGTKAIIEEETVTGALPFVKVKILDGDCQGKSGWTSKVNVMGP